MISVRIEEAEHLSNHFLFMDDLPYLFVYHKNKRKITLIEVGVTNQDILQTVESEKKRCFIS